ncbi:peptidoglycan-binding protein [Streptomyces sp. AD681]|uniref:peptidoglycan-binding protein n=1 Tax=Streptomyces sp. AD681 TaxID=3019069 RepID=UPI0022F17AAE|nr:peptidoglycan-binding protein [Streptomyces sp. AD681]MDA5146513.1 peptidoglycan-binding protein [Streptomyces sp. AD681]
MSRWKPLPAELHPRVHHLIVRLRGLKDRSGLGTRQLATKTGYSARSWQRYLNGRSLPPREAVEAMARIGGDDPIRLLALHETAAERWAEGLAVAADAPKSEPSASADSPTQQPYGGPPRALVTAGAVALVLSVSLSLLLAVRLADARAQLAHARADIVAATPSTVSESLVPVVYPCRPERRDGRWYAGLSRTTETVLAYTHVGPEVAEAQCLLRRAGTAPGDIDGVFGPKTQRAVIRLQTREGLVVDGVIGPHTWKALRKADSE